MATELFVKHLVEESCVNARMNKRKIARYDDMVRAVQQNAHLDFLRDVIPAMVPLSSALQMRENHEENPELIRLMANDPDAETNEAKLPEAAKPRVIRKAPAKTPSKAPSKTPSKARAEKTVEPEEAPAKEDLAAARAARRLSRSANAEANARASPSEQNAQANANANAGANADADNTEEPAREPDSGSAVEHEGDN
ncbi:DNA-directed DNA polymerase [Malassezia cuniculi]|uniref:DNA-directed DNA polymerase n=1 Tax=Malassezia cuniculi TaxID=948313 RepID=A0AAF0ET19_9BASI|nr:DNA-directed DNA polymerase [Malassezia cuniculi]